MNRRKLPSNKTMITAAFAGMIIALTVVVILIISKQKGDLFHSPLTQDDGSGVSSANPLAGSLAAEVPNSYIDLSEGTQGPGTPAGSSGIDYSALLNNIEEGDVSWDDYYSGYSSDNYSSLSHMEKWQEGSIRYKGQVYKYNNSIKTYLFMGIDNDGLALRAPDYVSGGQSDAMFLMIVDNKHQEVRIIAVNRNTMTDITVCDANGRVLGTFQGQLCLQHGYGDGLRLSCKRTTDAVSYLFYNIPISGYLAMNMGGLALLNDAVGGVEVTLEEDFVSPNYGIDFKAGERVLLKDKTAYAFIRYRDTQQFDSASVRLNRNKLYLAGLLDAFKRYTSGENSKALEIYDIIEPYTVTDIEFAEMAEDIGRYDFNSSEIATLEGETRQGTIYEEFYPEENALYDLIISNFYDSIP